jgi:hypothetical protein
VPKDRNINGIKIGFYGTNFWDAGIFSHGTKDNATAGNNRVRVVSQQHQPEGIVLNVWIV